MAIQMQRKIRKLLTSWEYFNRKLQEANMPERLLGHGPQFQKQEEWKPEPEYEVESEPESEQESEQDAEPESETEWKPKNPRKKEQIGKYIKA